MFRQVLRNYILDTLPVSHVGINLWFIKYSNSDKTTDIIISGCQVKQILILIIVKSSLSNDT